tara:strand:+ start:2413 stop:2838 length:426 start_codon:yes stop_codon:yes gene_type:complete
MKKLILIFILSIPLSFFAQTARDINMIIQKTIDLHALKDYYNENEKSGETPLIIINDDRIPNNLIVFKFNKRVKVMTYGEMETFKTMSEKNLDSYFVFEVIEFKDNEVKIRASFRKDEKIAINVSMKKENNNWLVVESKAG